MVLKVLKVKKVSIVSLITLMCLLIAPFHVYADAISQSNILGTTVSVEDVTVLGDNPLNNTPQQQATKEVNVILRFEVTLDDAYLGYMTGDFSCRILAYDVNGNTTYVDVNSGSKSYYVSGYSFVYYVSQKIYYNVTPSATLNPQLYNPSFTLAGSNVSSFEYLDNLDTIMQTVWSIEACLQDVTYYLYDEHEGDILEVVVETRDVLNDIYTKIGNIDNNVDIITKLKQWNVPIFSIPFVYNVMLRTQYDNIMLIQDFNYFQYPLFNIGNVTQLSSVYMQPNKEYVLIFGSTGNYSASSVHNAYTLTGYSYGTDNITHSTKILSNSFVNGYAEYRLFKFTITVNSADSIRLNYVGNTQQMFIPIYFGENHGYFDDQFKQMYDLIDTSHEEALDDSTSDMQTEFNTMFGYEDDFNNDMNTALQNIDVQFNVGNQLGSKFLASADWVRAQFNTLTSNTPFGTVLSFSLLLGLALLIIGKAVR